MSLPRGVVGYWVTLLSAIVVFTVFVPKRRLTHIRLIMNLGKNEEDDLSFVNEPRPVISNNVAF